MRTLVIGGRDAVLGFRLAGVEGVVASTPDESVAALNAALARKDLGLILITESAATSAREAVDARIYGTGFPLVVEVPDRAGPDPQRHSIHEIVRKAIGMNL